MDPSERSPLFVNSFANFYATTVDEINLSIRRDRIFVRGTSRDEKTGRQTELQFYADEVLTKKELLLNPLPVEKLRDHVLKVLGAPLKTE
jgi:hypothetical protein